MRPTIVIHLLLALCSAASILVGFEASASQPQPELSVSAFVDLARQEPLRGRRWGVLVLLRFTFLPVLDGPNAMAPAFDGASDEETPDAVQGVSP